MVKKKQNVRIFLKVFFISFVFASSTWSRYLATLEINRTCKVYQQNTRAIEQWG